MLSNGKENVGVYELITDLCNRTASNCSQSKVSQKALSAKMRSHAYEIILRKSKTEIPCCSGDPIKDLLSYHYILQKHVNNVAEYKRSVSLKNEIIEIRRIDFGDSKDSVYDTLKLLIALRDSVKNDFSEQMFQNPFSFGLLDEMLPKPNREPFGSPQPYPYFPSYVFELPYSLKTQGTTFTSQRSQSHTEYTVETFDSRSFLPDKYSQHGLLETKTFRSPMSLASMTSTCLSPYSETTLLNYPRLTAPRDLQIPSSQYVKTNVNVSLGSESVKADMQEIYKATSNESVDVDIWELAAQVDKDVPLEIWEVVSKLPSINERQLIATSTRELGLWKRLYSGSSELNVISERQFIRHIMYLIIGVETSSFPFSRESNGFYMKENLVLEGISKERLAGYVGTLLAVGTYYRRLYNFAFNHSFEGQFHSKGLVYEAAREEVRKYLLKFRLAATEIYEEHRKNPSEDVNCIPTLLQILRHMEPLKWEIETVAAIYKLIDTDRGNPLASGAELMSYFFSEVSLVTHQRTAQILFNSLVSVCKVYFKFIERFIFEGEVDDRFEEFFIRQEAALASARTKRCWDRGYHVAPAAVPAFLRPLAAAVLLCGKSLRLLKMCNPTDPVVALISAEHPSVRCCSSFAQLEEQRRLLDVYRTRCRFVRGATAHTVDDILAERKRLAQLIVAERQHAMRLRAQRAQHVQRAAEEVDAKLKEDERNKMMEYYSKLNMEVEKSKIHTEWKMKRLQLDQSRIQLLSAEERNLKREKLELEHQRNEAVMQMSIQSVDTKSEDDSFDDNDNNNGNIDNNAPITDSNVTESTPTNEVKESPEISNVVNKTKAESSSDVFSAICNVAKSIFGVSKQKHEIICDNQVVIDSQGNVVISNNKIKTTKTNTNNNTSSFSTSNEVIGANLNDVFDNQRFLEMRQEALKNKDRVMSHEFGETDNDNNETKNWGRSIKLSSVDEENNEEDWSPYAEARRNKRKVLGAEFGLIKEEVNVVTVEPRTEAQREALINKQKVLGVEYNLPAEIATKKEALNVAQEEAIRNKTKILGSEYETGTKSVPKPNWTRKSSLTLNLKPYGEASASNVGVASSSGALTPGDFFSGLDLETPTTADIPAEGPMTSDVFTPRSEGSKDLETGKVKPEKGFLTSDGFNFSLIVDEAAEAMSDIQTESPENSPSKFLDVCDTKDNDIKTSVFNILDGSYSLDGFDPFGVKDLNKFSKDYFNSKLNLEPSPFYTHPATIMEEVKKRPYNNIFSHYDIEEDDSRETSDNIATLTACLQRSVMLPLTYQLEVVNNSILTYFLVNLEMYEHLRCLKDYFFLMDGEFSRSICHNLFSKLTKTVNPQELFNFATLHNILDKALGSSISQVQSVSSKLSFVMSEAAVGVAQCSPDALRGLAPWLAVRWPLSIVLSREALLRYGTVFQFLIKMRRIAWVLAEDFQSLKLSAKLSRQYSRKLVRSPQYMSVQRFRHGMSSLVRALDTYIATSCILTSWTQFEDALRKARTLDDLYECHVVYVKKVLFRCLLNNRSTPVMKLINDIFTVILKFSRVLKAGEWQQKEANGCFTHTSFVQLEELFHLFEKLTKYLHKVITKLMECGYQRHLAELLTMINLNGYYDHNKGGTVATAEMAFMMPVVKNDWDIYNSQRSRRQSESTEKGGRVRKVSESRSEGPSLGARASALSPHRSAPAMRSLSYCRAPPSRVSLRAHDTPKGSASPPARESDKFPSRARGDSPRRERPSRCACMPYL